MCMKLVTKVMNKQDMLRPGSFLWEVLEIWLLRELPSMGVKDEVSGGAKPVQTRLCGSDGSEGAGIAT